MDSGNRISLVNKALIIVVIIQIVTTIFESILFMDFGPLDSLAAVYYVIPEFVLGLIGFILALVIFKKGFSRIALIGLVASICSMPLINIAVARFIVAPILSPIVSPIIEKNNSVKYQAEANKNEVMEQNNYNKMTQDLLMPKKVIGIYGDDSIVLDGGYIILPYNNDLPSTFDQGGSIRFGLWAQKNLVGQMIQIKIPPYNPLLNTMFSCDTQVVSNSGEIADIRNKFNYPDNITGVCDKITASIYLNGKLVTDELISTSSN